MGSGKLVMILVCCILATPSAAAIRVDLVGDCPPEEPDCCDITSDQFNVFGYVDYCTLDQTRVRRG